jgi:hypothetical protein
MAWLRNYLTGRSAFIEINGVKSNCFSLFKGVPQGSCVGPVLFIIFHYDLLNAVSSLHFKHLYADDLAVVITPSATWSSKVLIPYLSKQVSNIINDLVSYATTWKQPLNVNKTYWTLFHRQISPKIPIVYCQNNIIEHVPKFKYLGVILGARLSFNYHLDYIKSKIHKNIAVFKRLSSSRMLSKERNFISIVLCFYSTALPIHFKSISNFISF